MQHHDFGYRMAAFFGIVSGFIGKYAVLDNFLLKATSFPTRFVEAVITAVGCGIAGAFGKLLFDKLRVLTVWLIGKWKQWRVRRAAKI